MTRFMGAIALTLLVATAFAADSQEQVRAVKIAESWLQGIDQGRYADSWSGAAPQFQAAVTAQQWAAQLHIWREPMGKLLSRQLASAKYYTQLPGAPDGQYWIIQEQASFSNKQSAVETVTLMRAGDEWRPAGYFIR